MTATIYAFGVAILRKLLIINNNLNKLLKS